MNSEKVSVLKLTLHHSTVGYLAGFQDGRNVFTFSHEFAHNDTRPTLGLITHPAFPNANKIMSMQWVKRHRLHPIFSNLLPEGAMRDLITQQLKLHTDNEFQLLSFLGGDLPGALIATAIDAEEIPEYVLEQSVRKKVIKIKTDAPINKFSLAGIQLKFSMKHHDGRYNLCQPGELGNWIVKTPSTNHQYVPLNEYSSMKLAAMVDIKIPEIKLVELSTLDNLPKINLPNEQVAYAIKRFDRDNEERVHMEDFAQVFVKYPNDKYTSANYEQIAKQIYTYSGDGIEDAQQFARRLLVNILLANGDAHLKNWSLLYQDKVTPRLSPAYDIVTTCVYIENEKEFALNLANNKHWYSANMSHFEKWANKADIPWRIIKPHLDDTMEKARTLWPSALDELPMHDEHKIILRKHWKNLHQDFKI